MRFRDARKGSWLKERSIYTEKPKYREYNYKERVGKNKRPTESWDDIYVKGQISWKKHRKYQCKAIKVAPSNKLYIPLMGTELVYIGEDRKNSNWQKGHTYHLVESGFWFHNRNEFGVYVTNDYYDYKGLSSDSDYCTFIPIEHLFKLFKEGK